MTPDESTLDRIQKLLALADRGGTPEEGEAAMRKAQSLMIKHQLDEESVRSHAGSTRKGEPIVTLRHDLGKMIGRDRLISLASIVAKSMSCRVWYTDAHVDYWNGTTSGSVTVCGHKSDAEFVSMLWKHLMAQCLNGVAPAWQAAKRAGGVECDMCVDGVLTIKFHDLTINDDCYGCRATGMLPLPSPQTFRLGFIDGFVRAAGLRVKAMYADEVEASESTALVLRGRKDRVDDHVDENFNIKQDSSGWSRMQSKAGSGAGASAGATADVTLGSRGVDGKSKGRLTS